MAIEDVGIRVLILGLGEFRRGVGTARDDIRSLESSIRSVSQSGGSLGSVLTKIGSGIVGLGRTMTIGLTTPISLLVGSLTNAGIQFEDTFAGVSKTVDGVGVGFNDIAEMAKSRLGITVNSMEEARIAAERLGVKFGDLTDVGRQVREEFREVALSIPVTATELNKLGETVGALGVNAADIAEVTKLVAELGVATDISAEDAASGLVHMFNIVKKDGESMVDFLKSAGSALVALGNNSVSTEGEILALASRLSSAGDRANFSSQELLAWATTIADVGSRAEAGGTAVSRAINEMLISVQTGDENLQTFAAVTGQSVDEFVQLFEKDASSALLKFIQSLNAGIQEGRVTKDMLNDMGLGGIRALDVLGRLSEATDLYSKNLGISNTAWAEQIALEEEAEKRFSTVASQIQLAKNAFADLGITIFDLVKDDLINLIDKVKQAINWFKSMSPATQKVILLVAGLAAAVGPLLIVLGGVVSVIGTLITAAGALATPVGLAALAIGGLIVALGSIIGWDTILDGVSAAFDGIWKSVESVITIVDQLATKKATIQDVVNAIMAKPGEAMASVAGGGGGPQNVAPSSASAASSSLYQSIESTNDLQGAVDTLGIPPKFIADLNTLYESTSGIREAFSTLSESITTLFDNLASNQTFQDVTTKLPEDIKAVGDSLFGYVNTILDGIGQFSAGFMEGFTPFLEGAAPGIAKIMENLENAFGKLSPLFDTLSQSAAQVPWEQIGTILGKIAGLVFNALIDALVWMTDLIPMIVDSFISWYTIGKDVMAIIWDILGGSDIFGQKMQENFITLIDDVAHYFQTGFEDAKKFFTDFVDGIIDGATKLYETIVGHSIIPDLVDDVLGSFRSMKDGALELFDGLVKGAQDILSTLFGGGGGENAQPGIGVTVSSDQIAAAQQAVAALQVAWTTFITTANTQLVDFFTSVGIGFLNLGVTAAEQFVNVGAAAATLVLSLIQQFTDMQTAVVSVFTSIGTTASEAFASQIIANTTEMVAQVTSLMLMLDEYFLETVKHMVGHWLDFVAAANELSAEWANATLAIFDKVHNEGVGKIHQIRDAWKGDMKAMQSDSESLGETVGSLVGAFQAVGGAAGGAARAVWAAAKQMIAAMEAVQAAATGSPELKLHHSFERFEKYLGNTDFGAMMERQMAMPSYMTQISAVAPALAGGPSTTNIDRSLHTGDIVGSNLDSEDKVVETMTRIIRMADITGGT